MLTATSRIGWKSTDLGEYIGTMTVDKQTMKFVLSYGGKISNHYESATYRFIKGAIKRNIYPEYAYEGWG